MENIKDSEPLDLELIEARFEKPHSLFAVDGWCSALIREVNYLRSKNKELKTKIEQLYNELEEGDE